MSRLYTNNAVSSLSVAVIATDLSLVLQTGQGARFPAVTAGNDFFVTLVGIAGGVETSWEIVRVTARTGDTLTVVRAQEGSAAAAWAIATPVELRFTAGAAQSVSAKDDSGGYAGLTLFAINFKNALNTFTSLFTNANTAARTYTFPDRTGTIADNTDLATKFNVAGGTLTGALNNAATVTIASAATTDIAGAASNDITVTGVVAITALGTATAGAERVVTFAGALVLTHNVVSLILPGAASIATAAGDSAYFVSLGAGNWRCTGYQRASGAALTSQVIPQPPAAVLTNNLVATTETIVARWALPANYLTAGAFLDMEFMGQVSSTAFLSFKVRIGTAGTTADALAATFATTAAGSANAYASGNINLAVLTATTFTASGEILLANTTVGLVPAVFAAATIAPASPLFVSLTLVQSAAQTYTSRAASMQREI